MTVYYVVIDKDGTHDCAGELYRFRARANAEAFAAQHTYDGCLAEVQIDKNVPRRLVSRLEFYD